MWQNQARRRPAQVWRRLLRGKGAERLRGQRLLRGHAREVHGARHVHSILRSRVGSCLAALGKVQGRGRRGHQSEGGCRRLHAEHHLPAMEGAGPQRRAGHGGQRRPCVGQSLRGPRGEGQLALEGCVRGPSRPGALGGRPGPRHDREVDAGPRSLLRGQEAVPVRPARGLGQRGLRREGQGHQRAADELGHRLHQAPCGEPGRAGSGAETARGTWH
mmetsp:Transcript_41949/g.120416  ORF Transcript_41949/g.120416 Transcript_41949/m.120416 type:complete len:217 (+) Transcript_41949:491-1141(+)